MGLILSFVFGAGLIQAAEKPTAKETENRKSMAEAHRKMAECLDSSKTLKECRSEMRKNMAHCECMGESGKESYKEESKG